MKKVKRAGKTLGQERKVCQISGFTAVSMQACQDSEISKANRNKRKWPHQKRCHADGCRAWQGAAKQQVPGKRLKIEQVKHNRGELVKRLGRKPRPCASSLAGTQSLDRRRKDSQGLWQYLWFAVWRKQAGTQVLEKLGQLARNV